VKKKIKVLIASAAALGTVAVAGISYAAYARTNNADAVGTSEKFRPLTVQGQWLGTTASTGLLPGEAGDVKVVVAVSADNTVGARVTSIVPQAITAASISGIPTAQKEACANLLKPASYAPTNPNLVLRKGASNVELVLKEAVLFDSSATEACEGMSFATKWTVSFAPDRADSGLIESNTTNNVAATSRA
jgi:hypothetical protein